MTGHACDPPVDPIDGPDTWTCSACRRLWERRKDSNPDLPGHLEAWFEPAWGSEGEARPAAQAEG